MFKRIIATVFAFALTLGAISCGANFKAADGDPTQATYFEFELDSTGDGYVISANRAKKLPAIVVLPSEYEGKPITAIADEGFFGCESISTLSISATIEVVGKYAFKNCSNLSEVVFGHGRTAVEGSVGVYVETQTVYEYAFDGCAKLVKADLACVSSIGAHAFRKCSSSLEFINDKAIKAPDYDA